MTKVKLIKVLKGEGKEVTWIFKGIGKTILCVPYYLIYIVLWLKGSQSSLVGGGCIIRFLESIADSRLILFGLLVTILNSPGIDMLLLTG